MIASAGAIRVDNGEGVKSAQEPQHASENQNGLTGSPA